MRRPDIEQDCDLYRGVDPGTQLQAAPDERDVLAHYADMADAKYEDSPITARTLQNAVDQLVAKPSEDSLAEARAAWKSARAPYQQSEVYRFGNAIVDDWEGKVNACPMLSPMGDPRCHAASMQRVKWYCAKLKHARQPKLLVNISILLQKIYKIQTVACV